MGVAASKESKDKWRNKCGGGRATLIRHHKSLFDWDTSKQKAVISSGISCYRKTSEELGQPRANSYPVFGKCSCPWDERYLCSQRIICSGVIGSGDQQL